MMQYTVIFTPEAQEQLATLYHHIAAAASPKIAERYTRAIVTYCERLQTFPHRGNRRDDIRPGLRHHKPQKADRDRLRRGCRTSIHHWRVLRRPRLRECFTTQPGRL